jgi:membrane-associated phospholipid phosphatase
VQPGRWLLLAYPVAMGATLVYCAKHYVMDLLAGILLVAVVLAVMPYIEGSWEQRRAAGRYDLRT